jgi:hypothetical protein
VIEFGHSFAALRRLHFCTSGALRRSSNRQIPAFIPPMLRRPRRHHSGSHTRQIGHCSVGRVGHEGNPYALNGDSPYDSQRWCASPLFLHRHRWSHPRGAPRGQPRRHGSRDHEQHRGDREDSRVPRTDLKQQRRQPASEHQRTHAPIRTSAKRSRLAPRPTTSVIAPARYTTSSGSSAATAARTAGSMRSGGPSVATK